KYFYGLISNVFFMKKLGIEIKWAALITCLTVLCFVGEKLMGWHQYHRNVTVALLSFFGLYILIFGCYYFAYKEKKKIIFQNNWSIKDAFKFGLLLTSMVAILNPIAQYIMYESIAPDYFEQLKSHLTENHINAEMLIENINLTGYIRNGIIDTFSYGIIFTIGLSYLMKTKDYTPPVVVETNKKSKNKKRK